MLQRSQRVRHGGDNDTARASAPPSTASRACSERQASTSPSETGKCARGRHGKIVSEQRDGIGASAVLCNARPSGSVAASSADREAIPVSWLSRSSTVIDAPASLRVTVTDTLRSPTCSRTRHTCCTVCSVRLRPQAYRSSSTAAAHLHGGTRASVLCLGLPPQEHT